MKNKIIGFDFDGVIVRNDIGKNLAHRRWFEVMGHLLNDPSLVDYAGTPDYHKIGSEITSKFTGLDVSDYEKTLTFLGRNLYQMLYLHEFSTHDDPVYEDVVAAIDQLKERGYKIAVISGSPKEAVESICKKISLNVDYIYGSPVYEPPERKNDLLGRVLSEHKLYAYVTDTVSENTFVKSKDSAIRTFLAHWDSQDDSNKHTDFVIQQPQKILEEIK